jgi:glycosyltransferase involved in cell wall biosynthesis
MIKNIVTVIVTVRNEERHIRECLESILAFQTKNKFFIEVLVVDGMSTDHTREIISSMQNSTISIIENHKITQAHGINIGVRAASGAWVAWLGAHSVYPSNYLLGIYESAVQSGADYTGGVIDTVPFNDSYNASLVQALTTHKFGVGNSGFRVGAEEGPTDTASYGIFRKSIFSKIGFFNEQLLRAQDYEFNARIRFKGGRVWLSPLQVVKYKNQPNLLKFLSKQFMKEAPYNVYMWYLAPYTFAFRHGITGAFAFGFLSGLILSPFFPLIQYIFTTIMSIYFALSLVSGIQQAMRYKDIRHVVSLPFSFFSYHLIHGLGILKGGALLLFGKAPVQGKSKPVET